ncbi:GL26434 [Drosophila persimilis]|uniref:Metalloendopeptidase n=1 Tax=Drosophila persimilis TaxID=7234 RepID=B4GSR3_DROPE|nr:seminal metalloprotease 1 [Drosophila persimilis]EDW25422.1 GL26434 [Drosophila persimilis]
MCAAWIHLALVGLLGASALGAPIGEEDPEQTAGYFQGDMDVDFERNGQLSETRRWPNATVPYRIDEAFDAPQVAHIELGMRIIELSSCIRFVPADEAEENYLIVIPSTSGCSSKVGYQPGERTVKLKPAVLDTGCFRLGTIQHELLHTLGFHHQQCSPDRDDYVQIVEENISEGHAKNFVKYEDTDVGDYDQPYDYGSILHYSSLAFSVNGEPTIVALRPEGQSLMGQRLAMSPTDVQRLNTMYKCPIQL